MRHACAGVVIDSGSKETYHVCALISCWRCIRSCNVWNLENCELVYALVISLVRIFTPCIKVSIAKNPNTITPIKPEITAKLPL